MTAATPPQPSGPTRLVAVWLGTITLLAVTAQLVGFEFKDGDSRLYARQAAALAQAPFSTWMSPQWPPHYYKEGLFEEHLPVFFWPMALLGKLGVAEIPAALWCNFFYLAVLLLALYRLGALLGGVNTGHLAAWCGLLSVGGFIYGMRANHEMAVAAGVAWAVLAAVQPVRHLKWLLVLVASVVWCVAMKGLVGLVVLPALGALVLVMGNVGVALPGLVAATLGAGIFLGVFDVAFSAANGHSFLEAYLNIHTGYAEQREQASALRKLKNVAYYLGAWAWWFFPWTLLLLRDGTRAMNNWRKDRKNIDVAARFVLGLAVASLIYMVFFSAFDRRASRYIFGIQPLVAAAVAPGLPQRLKHWMDPRVHHAPYWLAAAFVVVMGVRLAAHLFLHVFYSFNLANPD